MMCLQIDWKKTNKIKKDIFAYKVLQFYCRKLTSPFQGVEYNSGINKPDNRYILDKSDIYIGGGAIHVYTNLKSAKTLKCSFDIIIRFKIPKKDIIAFGFNDDVAITKLKISEKLYKKIMYNLERGIKPPSFYIG